MKHDDMIYDIVFSESKSPSFMPFPGTKRLATSYNCSFQIIPFPKWSSHALTTCIALQGVVYKLTVEHHPMVHRQFLHSNGHWRGIPRFESSFSRCMACRPINSLASDKTTSLLSTAMTWRWWPGDEHGNDFVSLLTLYSESQSTRIYEQTKKLHNLHDFKRAWYWLWYHLRWIAGDRDHPDSKVISPRKKWKKACNSNKKHVHPLSALSF